MSAIAEKEPHVRLSAVRGYFMQDEDTTDAQGFKFMDENFGLKERPYLADSSFYNASEKTLWQRFEREVERLNQESRKSTIYKLLYMGRHGQGTHNVGEDFYGFREWEDHWAKLDGNGTTTWADAHLTEIGAVQALRVNRFWRRERSEQHIPLPQADYTSPLYRCLETAKLTFSSLHPAKQVFAPTIKELLRETIGVHTCDRRSNKTSIHKDFPHYVFEPGFSERDQLWDADVRETDSETDERMKTLLDDIFTNDGHTFISLTSHSGAISSMLRVVGHREFQLVTGAVIPVLVKADFD